MVSLLLVVASSKSLTDLSSRKYVTFLYVCIFFKNSHTPSTFYASEYQTWIFITKTMFEQGSTTEPTKYVSDSLSLGFSGGSVVKHSPANAGDSDSIPGSRRSPGGENGNPVQYSCLGNPTDRRAWWATVHGVPKEPDMT